MLTFLLGTVCFVAYAYAKERGWIFSQRRRARIPLPPDLRAILAERFTYYRRLSPPDQARFEDRVQYFLLNKRFEAWEMRAVTDEMRVLIAATAVQITFGLQEPILFFRFERILVYPDRYYHLFTEQYHAGEVSELGFISLSWRHFEYGLLVPDDGLNVGLHEMAHALHLENFHFNEEYEFIHERYFNHWYDHADAALARVNEGELPFFRQSAGHNTEEFFAVSVEYFFEKPHEFSATLPELYGAMARLLNQDPAEAGALRH